MPLLAQYVGVPPSCAGNGDMMRGLPGGSSVDGVVPEGDRGALEAVEAEGEAPRGEVVARADQVVLHRVGMENARVPQLAARS